MMDSKNGLIEIPAMLVIYAPIITITLQSLRNIPAINKISWALPFVAMGCGVAIAFLGMPQESAVQSNILTGLLLGCSASGLHGASQSVGLDKVIRPNHIK